MYHSLYIKLKQDDVQLEMFKIMIMQSFKSVFTVNVDIIIVFSPTIKRDTEYKCKCTCIFVLSEKRHINVGTIIV